MRTLHKLFIGGLLAANANAQTPVALRPDITVSLLMNAQLGAVRIAQEPVSGNLLYSTLDGNIFKIIIPAAGAPYDTLVYTVLDHGVEYMQGMAFHDSCIYITGNNGTQNPYTVGKIMQGKLQPNGLRIWTTVAETQAYEQSGIFDHRISGTVLNKTGDTIFVSSGARTDHGDIQTHQGLFPGVREVPLTSVVLAVPTWYADSIIPNDMALLDAGGYAYVRGNRNYFDMAFSPDGNLFALENSGDRDHNEEMNWLRPGKHYGFPWMMGTTYNPQQFPGWDPSTDLLINHNSISWGNGSFYNDSTFPAQPTGVSFELPVKNIGPDADKFRDTLTGSVMDASDLGISISTFTAHRSPLGLVFDTDSIFGNGLTGHGFMLSYTTGGDSAGNAPQGGMGPMMDPSEDLIDLNLVKDTVGDNYIVSATRIVGGFTSPVDAEKIDTVIYVLENSWSTTPHIWQINMPRNNSTSVESVKDDFNFVLFPNPAKNEVMLLSSQLSVGNKIIITDAVGKIVFSEIVSEQTSKFRLQTTNLKNGIYFVTVNGNNFSVVKKMIKM